MKQIPNHPIESFDPLLRDLASYGLVVRDDSDGDVSWHLTDEAQDRLSQILRHRLEPMVPEKLVYFDHLCAACRMRGLTRLRDGLYLCESCARARAEEGDGSEGASGPLAS